MTACARSCTIRKKHLNTCPVADHANGIWTSVFLDDPVIPELCDADARSPARQQVEVTSNGGLRVWFECPGCKPRMAEHGLLCATCHHHLSDWLSGDHGLLWVHGWLDENLAAGGTSAAKQDWQRPGGEEGAPTPLRLAILDHQTLLTDRVFIAEERTREVFDRPTRDVFDLGTAVNFLLAWLAKIEDEEELVVWMYEKLYETMRDAAALAPWRDKPRRLPGISCPYCDCMSLVVYSGDEAVTCLTCRGVIPKERYSIWIRVLLNEAQGTLKTRAS